MCVTKVTKQRMYSRGPPLNPCGASGADVYGFPLFHACAHGKLRLGLVKLATPFCPKQKCM